MNMYNRKKGFTLIELLAVIVILAIIALIAVPITLNLVENSRIKAALTSAYAVEKAAEDKQIYNMVGDVKQFDERSYYCNGINCSYEANGIIDNLQLQGSVPSSGLVTVGTDGLVSKIENLIIDDYVCNKEKKGAEIYCRKIGDLSVKIVYDLNDGIGNCDAKTLQIGDVYGNLCEPKRDEYIFVGWWEKETNNNGSGKQITSTTTVAMTSATTKKLYAKWAKEYNELTVSSGLGIVGVAASGSDCSLKVATQSTYICKYNTEVTLTGTPDDGYELSTWEVTAGEVDIDQLKTGKFIMPASNLELKATGKFKTYTVTLNNQGATVSGTESINVVYKSEIPTIIPPEKEGYIFDGYYTEELGKGTKYINSDGTGLDIWLETNVETLYAKWKPNAGIIPTILNKEFDDGENEIKIGDVTYPVRIINVYDGGNGDDDKSVNGKITISSDKNYGDETDVGTQNSNATRMVIVKYHGNVVIESTATVSSVKSGAGYGGPKGMFLCATGTLTNYGTISMTQRGAKAIGEDVYLYLTDSGEWEFVPKTGGVGGNAFTVTVTTSGKWNTAQSGNAGADGSNRSTGGGGSSMAYAKKYVDVTGTATAKSGAGSAGTSYSGGSGGGGSSVYVNSNSSRSATGGSAIGNGGAGGAATGSNASSYPASGGTGNPGGAGANGGGTANGTGGLLIIYAESLFNQSGTIESTGTNGSNIGYASGGASGGGSINIFYKSEITEGEIKYSGGAGSVPTKVSTTNKGGAGGSGTSTILKIDV